MDEGKKPQGLTTNDNKYFVIYAKPYLGVGRFHDEQEVHVRIHLMCHGLQHYMINEQIFLITNVKVNLKEKQN